MNSFSELIDRQSCVNPLFSLLHPGTLPAAPTIPELRHNTTGLKPEENFNSNLFE